MAKISSSIESANESVREMKEIDKVEGASMDIKSWRSNINSISNGGEFNNKMIPAINALIEIVRVLGSQFEGIAKIFNDEDIKTTYELGKK